MKFHPRPARILPLILAAALLAGCAARDDAPARKAIDQIDAAITAAGPDATKYIPRHVSTLKAESTQLKVKYYEGDYKGIVEAAPAILGKAQDLPRQAAAKKTQVAASLAGEWTNLETSVPEAIAAVQKHADELRKSGNVTAGPAKTLLDAAGPSISEQKALWDKAIAAKAAGDIEQAVTLAAYAKHNAEALLAALGGSNG
jgi:hypothetical protein